MQVKVYLFEGEVVRGGEHHHSVVHGVLLLLLRLKRLHIQTLKKDTESSISLRSAIDQLLINMKLIPNKSTNSCYHGDSTVCVCVCVSVSVYSYSRWHSHTVLSLQPAPSSCSSSSSNTSSPGSPSAGETWASTLRRRRKSWERWKRRTWSRKSKRRYMRRRRSNISHVITALITGSTSHVTMETPTAQWHHWHQQGLLTDMKLKKFQDFVSYFMSDFKSGSKILVIYFFLKPPKLNIEQDWRKHGNGQTYQQQRDSKLSVFRHIRQLWTPGQRHCIQLCIHIRAVTFYLKFRYLFKRGMKNSFDLL